MDKQRVLPGKKRRGQPAVVKEPLCSRCGYSWEGHDEGLGPYNKWCLRRWAAGVVPCFTDQDSGEPFFLFGKENRHDGGYNCFWGFGDMDEYMPYESAARECAEESLGLIGSCESLAAVLKDAISLDGQGLLFTLYMGTQRTQELLAEYDKRHSIWRRAMLSLSRFSVRNRQPGGDVMEQLVVVRAQDVLKAAAKCKRLCLALPETKECHVAQPCYDKNRALQPRPPIEWLLQILGTPVTDAARYLTTFCQLGSPPPGPSLVPQFSSPIPGIQPNGNPNGRAVGSVIAFLATWTGGHGINAPPSPIKLAADVLALPRDVAIISDAVHMCGYVREWTCRALDSPAVAMLACDHLSALAGGLGEAAAGVFASAVAQQIYEEMADAGNKFRRDGSTACDGGVCVAAAYRWLCALHFAECLVSSLPGETLKQHVVAAVRKASADGSSVSQVLEVAVACLKSRLRPCWLPGAAFSQLCERSSTSF